ncbi:unnamed protein product [Lepeophtheirus salmonis]|uniref:(salmon louse) hypothetical protein n=1 Tax=Lepeophtheirus salmonis TaxID=72036 RepID=A0A7R8CY42_LEPSM|nr:unnamed protein product [Lepeophtheirus salmonis]CAF2937977.1 unnamed protein product [Lepeophtheirus salmonis]
MSQIQYQNLKNLKNPSPDLIQIEVVKQKDVIDFDIVCENIIKSSQQEDASQFLKTHSRATNSKKKSSSVCNVEACPIPVFQKKTFPLIKAENKNPACHPEIKNNTSNQAGWINSFTPVSSQTNLNEPVNIANEKEIIDSNSKEENGKKDLMRPSFFELASIENDKKVTKPINDFIEYYIRAKSGYTINVRNFNGIWKLANHNEKTLQLEANLLYNQLPQNISIRELLDVTVDYFMRDDDIKEQLKLDKYEFTTEYLQSLLDTVKLVDQCKSLTKQLHDFNYGEKKVKFFQRLKTLENLRSFIESRVSQSSKMSPGAYYLSLVVQYILAHVEISLCSLKRMHRVYGCKCLKEFLEEKISPFMEYIPEEIMSLKIILLGAMEMEMKEPINAIIEALKLDKHSSEEKLVIVVDHLRKVSNSNISYKEENINLKEQLAKSDETKVALKKLTDALRAQINLTKEENTLKLKEETQKRLECSIMFEEQIKELAVLVTTQSENNTKLREENLSITEKNKSLQLQLFEAQLSKAKVERAEQTAEHTQDRLGLQQVILELREENDLYRQRERLMKEQIEIYTAQSQEVEKSLGDSGSSIQHFRKQIEKLNLKLQQVECDTAEWRHKFEASNEQVKKMNKLSLERDREMEIFKKKLAVMENLNRALHEELKNTKNSN